MLPIRCVCFSAALLCLATGSPAAAERYNWTGGYVGVYAGDSWLSPHSSSLQSVVPNGPTVGGVVGLTYDFGGLFLGSEADLALPSADDPDWSTSFASDEALDFAGSLRLRTGLTFRNVMAYGSLGYSIANTVTDWGSDISPAVTSFHSGWSYGGGLELGLAHGLRIGADYRQIGYSDPVGSQSTGRQLTLRLNFAN
jgi:opacity protein-like surface antigen